MGDGVSTGVKEAKTRWVGVGDGVCTGVEESKACRVGIDVCMSIAWLTGVTVALADRGFTVGFKRNGKIRNRPILVSP